jgi:hypothetical protein
MPRLINIKTMQPIDVPSNQAKALINSKEYGIMPDDVLELKTRTGLRLQKKGQEALDSLKADDVDLASDEELNQERLESEYGNTIGEVESFVAGGLSSASFGLFDVGMRKLADAGIIRPETLKNLKDVNPDAYLLGEIGGLLSPTARIPVAGAIKLARGVKALATAGKLGKASSALNAVSKAPELIPSKTLQKAFKMGMTGAVDIYAYQAGRNLSEAYIEDKDLTAEHLLVDPVEMVPYGFGLGAALPLIGAGFKKLGRVETIKKTREGLTNAFISTINRAQGKTTPEKILNVLGLDQSTKLLLKDRPAFTKEWIKENFSNPKLADEFIKKYESTIMTDEAKLENFSNYASIMFSKGEEGTLGLAKEVSENITPVKGLIDLQKKPTGEIIFPKNLEENYVNVYAKNKLVKDAIGAQIGESINKIGSVYDELLSVVPVQEVAGEAPKLFTRELGNIKDEISKKYSSQLSADSLKKFDDEVSKFFQVDRTNTLKQNKEFLIKKDVDEAVRKLGLDVTNPNQQKLLQQIRANAESVVNRNIKDVKEYVPTVNELYALRSKMSELSSSSILPKDKVTFYKISDYLDHKIINATAGELDRFQGNIADFVGRYKNPSALEKKLIEANFPEEIRQIIKDSRVGEANKLDKRLLSEKIMERYNLDDTFKKMLNDRASYYNAETLDEILSKIHSKSMSKGLTFKDWKNSIHLGIGVMSGPTIGAGTFLADQALDAPKVKLFMLEAFHNIEKKANKNIGTSAYETIQKLKPLKEKIGNPTRLIYPAIKDKDYKKNVDEVSKMIRVDENNIEQVVEANLVFSTETPEIFGKYIETYNRAVDFISSKIPPMEMNINGDNKDISDLEKRRFNRYYNAVKNPYTVLEKVANFTATPEEIETLKVVFPAMFQTALEAVMELLPEIKDKHLTYDERIFLTDTFGINLSNSMEHGNLSRLQSKYQQAGAGQQNPLSSPQGTSNNRTRKLGVTQYKGAINRNATSLQKIQGK